LSEKETKYIKLDNELRTKKKEVEKLQKKLDEGGNNQAKEGSLPPDS
jgi:predicted RNase H-like nuclease (RuvC/YqgF family)